MRERERERALARYIHVIALYMGFADVNVQVTTPYYNIAHLCRSPYTVIGILFAPVLHSAKHRPCDV